jgi:RNA polymerase sigma-70 factor (ECF subfamily)
MDNNIRKIYSDIYDQNVEKIYRFVFLKVNSQEIAEDITSEVFTRGWQSIQSKNIENPRAFLYQIARNLVVDHYREKGRIQVVSAENMEILDPRPTTEEKAIFNFDLTNIKSALSRLNGDYQTVLIWHYIDDLPVPEIAKILNKPEGTVRVMLHRALNSLRSQVKEG